MADGGPPSPVNRIIAASLGATAPRDVQRRAFEAIVEWNQRFVSGDAMLWSPGLSGRGSR